MEIEMDMDDKRVRSTWGPRWIGRAGVPWVVPALFRSQSPTWVHIQGRNDMDVCGMIRDLNILSCSVQRGVTIQEYSLVLRCDHRVGVISWGGGSGFRLLGCTLLAWAGSPSRGRIRYKYKV